MVFAVSNETVTLDPQYADFQTVAETGKIRLARDEQDVLCLMRLLLRLPLLFLLHSIRPPGSFPRGLLLQSIVLVSASVPCTGKPVLAFP